MASPVQSTIDMVRELEYKRRLMGSQNSVGFVPPSMGATPYLTDGTAVPPHTHALMDGTYTGVSTGNADHTHTYAGHAQGNVQPGRWSETNLLQMLSSRMCWGINGTPNSFRRVVPFRVNDDTVVVFIVTSSEALMLNDDANLFPSDALVTQVRLLQEAQ